MSSAKSASAADSWSASSASRRSCSLSVSSCRWIHDTREVYEATPALRAVTLGADAVAGDVARHLPSLARRRGLDAQLLLAALSVVPIEWIPETENSLARRGALRRIGQGDPSDWPTVAVARVRSAPIWPQDKDLEDSGLRTYSTGELVDLLTASR